MICCGCIFKLNWDDNAYKFSFIFLYINAHCFFTWKNGSAWFEDIRIISPQLKMSLPGIVFLPERTVGHELYEGNYLSKQPLEALGMRR